MLRRGRLCSRRTTRAYCSLEERMKTRILRAALCAVAALSMMGSLAPAADAQQMRPAGAAAAAAAAVSAAMAAQQPGPVAYDTFVEKATIQPGLLPIIHKQGRLYLAIPTAQLGKDYIEHSEPSSGFGGPGPNPGDSDLVPARILRFERVDDTIVMRWPNTVAQVNPNSPQQVATTQTLPNSVIAVTPIVAQNDNTVVISAQPFLGDLSNFARQLQRRAFPPGGPGYNLDMQRSFFAQTKAFPENDVIRVDQTWVTNTPDPRFDTAPDGRQLELVVTYNIIAAPTDGYVPRMADPRVGYFSQPAIDFRSDDNPNRVHHYVIRWNFAPADPTRQSKATHPAIFYLSNTIPTQYRDVVRAALLTWNDAFRKAGILDAVQVADQPNDPNWDPEDIRHNMIRWIDTAAPPFGAEALLTFDPRTGQELNVGVDVDAIEGLGARTYRYLIAPARGIPDTVAGEREYTRQAIRSVVLHESGHDFGLEHNFIGSEAYSAQQVQSKAFTEKYGVANSVMEYNPINLWPRGTPQGDYEQVVLGPYDYYAIKYGYQPIPNAHSAQDEVSTLHRWASGWTNPWTRFAGDEDAD